MSVAAEASTIGFGRTPVRAVSSAVAPRRELDPLSQRARRMIRQGYDAAATTAENRRHWANADALSARAAHSPAVRRMLRIRARHEIANCPLARGILTKLADFVVGTGPRLQVTTLNRTYNRYIETEFNRWCVKAKFARKLWQMRFSKAQNGEAFAVFGTNYRLSTPVKLDVRTIEADQVADPSLVAYDTTGSDGILFDDFGNPLAYRILKQHPGDLYLGGFGAFAADTEPAENVLHYFNAERAGQVRGVPEVTAGLPLYAFRRRYMLAVVAAAETAANHAGVIKTNASAVNPDDTVESLDEVELSRNSFTTLPFGWDLGQLKAEQPTTTFDAFDRALIREIARCVNMPYGIAAGDSSPYNFASGKLDLTPWFQTVRIEQDRLEDDVVDPTFERWYHEARLIPGYLPAAPEGFNARYAPPHGYFWDGQELLDPRETGAKAESLKNGFGTQNRIWARQGLDVVDEWEREAVTLGLTIEQYRELIIQSVFGHRDAAAKPPLHPGDPNADA